MKKIINFNAIEALCQNSLMTIKGGTDMTSPFTGGASSTLTTSTDGGNETDKRAKRPTLNKGMVVSK